MRLSSSCQSPTMLASDERSCGEKLSGSAEGQVAHARTHMVNTELVTLSLAAMAWLHLTMWLVMKELWCRTVQQCGGTGGAYTLCD